MENTSTAKHVMLGINLRGLTMKRKISKMNYEALELRLEEIVEQNQMTQEEAEQFLNNFEAEDEEVGD
jgi:acyl-[acyl carrier protein]--UDP-N-acetylglucosamine O-acyltransferase